MTEETSITTVEPQKEPLSSSDERTWAMLAHLSILLNLITGILGPLVALVIYLYYKDRSEYVAFNALQSFLFQLVFWVGAGLLAGLLFAISGVLSIIIVGLICLPFACVISLVPVAALVFGVIGAIDASQGKDFEYILVGPWARNILTD
jgi:hypothetical protein